MGCIHNCCPCFKIQDQAVATVKNYLEMVSPWADTHVAMVSCMAIIRPTDSFYIPCVISSTSMHTIEKWMPSHRAVGQCHLWPQILHNTLNTRLTENLDCLGLLMKKLDSLTSSASSYQSKWHWIPCMPARQQTFLNRSCYASQNIATVHYHIISQWGELALSCLIWIVLVLSLNAHTYLWYRLLEKWYVQHWQVNDDCMQWCAGFLCFLHRIW